MRSEGSRGFQDRLRSKRRFVHGKLYFNGLELNNPDEANMKRMLHYVRHMRIEWTLGGGIWIMKADVTKRVLYGVYGDGRLVG